MVDSWAGGMSCTFHHNFMQFHILLFTVCYPYIPLETYTHAVFVIQGSSLIYW